METNPAYIYTGESILLFYSFIDTDGNPVDPPDARVTIVRNVTQFVAGPFTYEDGQLTRLDEGEYEYEWTPSPVIVPGTYRAKWEGSIDDENVVVNYFDFQILDQPIELSNLLDPPRTVGIMRPSAAYQKMGLGTTDRLFLVGHSGGLNINDPYQVVNMQEAINILGGDQSSPMIRGLLEAYNVGCRDIWLVAAAPLSEYVTFDPFDEETRFISRPEWDGLNFYERYAQRLETTYQHLEGWDIVEIMCLLEAPFYDARGVDFLTPLQQHCVDAFTTIGMPRIGILGTRIINATSADIDAMVADDRLIDNGGGKFIGVIIGEGSVSLSQLPTSHLTQISTIAAAALATNKPHQGLTWRQMPNVIGINGQDLTKDQVKALANAKLNPAVRTEKSRRGNPFNVVIACDNSLSADGSDFWSLATTRILSKIINQIKVLGNKYIGTIAFNQFKVDVKDTLAGITAAGYIRGWDANITVSTTDPNKVVVEAMIQPYTTVREVLFMVETGSGVA